MSKIDWTKPVVWPNDHTEVARVLATDLPGEYPVAVHIMGNVCRYTLDGVGKHAPDLCNLPEKPKFIERWLVLTSWGAIVVASSKENAEMSHLAGVVHYIAWTDDGKVVADGETIPLHNTCRRCSYGSKSFNNEPCKSCTVSIPSNWEAET